VVGGLAGFGKTMLVAHLLGQLAPSPAVQFVLVDGKGGPDYDRLNPRAWLHAKDDLVYVRTQRGPRSRAWKAPPGSSSMPDARPMPQVRSSCSRPLLSVGDRQMPVLRARGGHGRRGPTAFRHGGDGHKLNWRVRPVRDDHCIFGKPPKAARQAIASGITIARAGCSDLLGLKAVSVEFRALWRQRGRAGHSQRATESAEFRLEVPA
jgi:hypothetical protein